MTHPPGSRLMCIASRLLPHSGSRTITRSDGRSTPGNMKRDCNRSPTYLPARNAWIGVECLSVALSKSELANTVCREMLRCVDRSHTHTPLCHTRERLFWTLSDRPARKERRPVLSVSRPVVAQLHECIRVHTGRLRVSNGTERNTKYNPSDGL